MSATNSFLKRARLFCMELQKDSYPNASSLAKLCECSRNTAQRTIYRLQEEYLAPIEYDASEKGYYLTNKDFNLPSVLPPGRDELTALLLARSLIATYELGDLEEHLDSLWCAYASVNHSVERDLAPLAKVFSSDSTTIGDMTDTGVLTFVNAAARGDSVSFHYESPWKKNGKNRKGRIHKVHFSDGILYLLFQSESGKMMVLNASFVKEFTILDYTIDFKDFKPVHDYNFLQGFGIWTAKELEEIEIRILAPASSYYATQRWHEDQVDNWDGDTLIRTFSSMVNPELARKVMSVGKFIDSIKPQSLKDFIVDELKIVLKNLNK